MPDLGRKLLRLTGPGKGAAATTTIDTTAGSATLGQVLSIALTAPGSGYQAGATVNIAGGGGSGATATAAVNPTTGAITSLTLTAPGAGYTTAPLVSFISNGLASATNPATTPIIPLGAQMVDPTDSVLGPFKNPSNVNGGRGINLTYTELIQWAFLSPFWGAGRP